jgi:hypothetical protein
MNKDFRKEPNKIKENEFICKLRKNKMLYEYANKILFGYITSALKNGLSKNDIIDIIEIEIVSNKSNKNKSKKNTGINSAKYTRKTPIIFKNGYDCENYDCNILFDFKNYKQLLEYNLKHNISIMQITSSYYKFQINNTYFTSIYKKDPVLKKKIVNTFNQYFLTNYNFNEIDDIQKKSEGHWFYTWLLVFLNSPKKNLMHRNSSVDKDYVRKWVTDITMKDIVKTPQKKLTCIENMYDYKYDIVRGDTYMKPVENGIFWNVMKKNNKEITAGFSSSSVLFYNAIFNITHILKATNKNKVIVLCLILLDYYESFHSMSEVLSFYSIEAGFDDYKLHNNDVNYVKNKINKYVPELFI